MNRLRLLAAYVAIMLCGLLLFAALSLFAIDRTQRSTLDARLETAARAAVTFIDVSHGHVAVDADDRKQFLTVLGADTDGAVFDPSGRVLLASSARIAARPPPVASLQVQRFDAGSGDSAVRAFSLPMLHHGRPIGTVVVWRGSEWIDDTDRGLAVALAAGALLIAGLALLTGNLVTRRALDDAFARQRRFTADASHELRAPLAVIRAEADLALRKEREPATYQSAMKTIVAEADHMETLIGDLLSAARAESGKVLRERVDVGTLLQHVAQRLASATAAKDAAIDIRTQEGTEIVADARALERALLAIAHNAVTYAPPQGGRVALETRRADRYVEIVIHDNGPGFTPEALEHASERFWRDEAGRTHGGTGLGLAIARSIVEASGGTIALANGTPGAQVRMRFPAAPRSD